MKRPVAIRSGIANRPLSDCPTGKRAYDDERTAQTAMRRVRKIMKGKPGGMPKRIYLCPLCATPKREQWHMTSSKYGTYRRPQDDFD